MVVHLEFMFAYLAFATRLHSSKHAGMAIIWIMTGYNEISLPKA
jgi:hypothetical protein